MLKDVLGKETKELIDKKLYLFDMDGTIYTEGVLFEGTLELLKEIENKNGKYVFITNNSSKSVKDYVAKLSNMGIAATEENFCTSSQATGLYLNETYKGKKVFCVGTKSFLEELASFGIELVDADSAEVVVVGYDTELNYEKLIDVCRALSTKDIPFIATNPDLGCPASFGFVPDCGAICNMISTATHKEPFYIGKPKPTMVELVVKDTGYKLEETVVVGDRLYTDIACGVNAKVTAICVLTGEATLQEIAESEIKPHYVFENINDLYLTVKEK